MRLRVILHRLLWCEVHNCPFPEGGERARLPSTVRSCPSFFSFPHTLRRFPSSSSSCPFQLGCLSMLSLPPPLLGCCSSNNDRDRSKSGLKVSRTYVFAFVCVPILLLAPVCLLSESLERLRKDTTLENTHTGITPQEQQATSQWQPPMCFQCCALVVVPAFFCDVPRLLCSFHKFFFFEKAFLFAVPIVQFVIFRFLPIFLQRCLNSLIILSSSLTCGSTVFSRHCFDLSHQCLGLLSALLLLSDHLPCFDVDFCELRNFGFSKSLVNLSYSLQFTIFSASFQSQLLGLLRWI